MKHNYADEKQKSLWKKFPASHYLSNPNNLDHVFLWCTFYRKNLHLFVRDVLGIKLYLFQAIIIYLMGISQFFVMVATRSASKSFLISIYAVSRCILYPKTKFVIASATKGQSKLIVTEKIKNELMNMSPALRREISSIKDNQNDVIITFRNGSTITAIPALDSARGLRSNAICREEFRQIDKRIDDSVISPFQIIRPAPYLTDDFYKDIAEVKEEPVDIYISSSWFDGHYMWNICQQALDGMISDKPMTMLAVDLAVVINHSIKSRKQMKRERKKQDPTTWALEFLNLRLKSNERAYFEYELLNKNQRLRQPFYPRKHMDVKMNKKNPYAIPKQNGEVRIIAVDCAFIKGSRNDNSIYSCIRALPESVKYQRENTEDYIMSKGYRRQLNYMEAAEDTECNAQAIRIRQLYADYNADYIVIDQRNAGVSIITALQRPLYDPDRNVEYEPLLVMNNDDIAKMSSNPNAKPVIYTITASQKLNSDIAMNFRTNLENEMIDLLVPLNIAQEDVLPNIDGYSEAIAQTSIDDQLAFEKPFLETSEFISETINLIYEKKEQTGAVVISETGTNCKDRYTSFSYGSYFIDKLAEDLLSAQDEYETCVFVN